MHGLHVKVDLLFVGELSERELLDRGRAPLKIPSRRIAAVISCSNPLAVAALQRGGCGIAFRESASDMIEGYQRGEPPRRSVAKAPP